MENTDFDFWMFVAGLGMFLFGMRHLEESLKGLAGKSFRKLLQRFTNRSWRGIITGASVTAILQSSTMVTLLALAFLGGGLIGLKNAVGIVLGANLGTTFTAWIVATFGFKMDIADFSFPFLAVGILSYIFLHSRPFFKNLGGLLIGFGLLFLGLDYMKVAIENVAGQIDITAFAEYGLWTFVIIAIVITALIQSSSAMIVIILSALNAGFIDIYQAVAMVIGANIGTTSTLVFISLGGTADTKRLMLAHVLFNVVTGTLIFFLIKPLVTVVYYIFGVTDPLMELVLLNSLLNLIGILLFYPFLGLFETFLNHRFISDAPEGETLYVKNISPKVPDVALEALDKELLQVYLYTREFIKLSFGISEKDQNHESHWKKIFASASGLMKKYEKLKRLEDELTTYYAQLQTENLLAQEASQLTASMMGLRSFIYAAKDIKDVMHNIRFMMETEDEIGNEVLERLRGIVNQRLAEVDRFLDGKNILDNPLNWHLENENFYNDIIGYVYSHLRDKHKKGVPVSTITNVINQTVSSLDNLGSAIIYWKLKRDTTVDTLEREQIYN